MYENALKRLKSYAEDILRDRRRLVRILLIVFILMLALLLRVHENSKADITIDNNSSTAAETTEESDSEICVDIGGAVVSPGVYTVSPETRLYEVIEMAGGLADNADTDLINRAAYVEDGEKIIIPRKAAASEDGENASGESSEKYEGTSGTSEAASVSSGLININYASREELMTLSGIGEAKADKIIEYRSSTKFRKKEDIKSVNGIGDAVYNKIKDSITV